MATVAVVIPSRNRPLALLRALASVRCQTHPPDELIVVDDASTPPLRDLLKAEPDVLVVTNATRRGAAFSRNRGVEVASSELIAFLDSDDYWAPEKLERQGALFSARPETDLVYCDQYVVDAAQRTRPSGKTMVSKNVLKHLIGFWTAPNTSTIMMRRSSFLRLGGFDETLTSCQDHDLWMRIATRGLVVGCVPERLSYFCTDQRERVSGATKERMAGVEAFLAKWRATIIAEGGKGAFRRFRNRYYAVAAVPLLTAELRRGGGAAWSLFLRYLMVNPEFYLKAFRQLLHAGSQADRSPPARQLPTAAARCER